MNREPFRRRAASRWNPLAPDRSTPPDPVYVDGCYLISDAGEAATWAVCQDGRWGIVYGCSGRQILSAWVDARDLPLHVLADALPGGGR